jgi:hypothetical protein
MGLADLTQLEILQGSTSLIYAITGTIIGAIIASKYFTFKRKELLGIGLSLILLTAPWYGGGISFLMIIFFDSILDDSMYFFINYGLIAFALLGWMWGISILLFEKSVKKIMAAISAICIPYEIILVILLAIDPSLVGKKEGKFNSDAGLLPTIFIAFALILTLITMLMFIRQSLRSDNLKIKWKGKFLLIAVILMIIGSFLDASITLTPTTLLITRIILMWRLLFSYLGWLLPDPIANWLIKDKE